MTRWLLRAPIARAGPPRRLRKDDESEQFFGITAIELHGCEERQSRVEWVGRKGEDAQWSRPVNDTLSAVAVPFGGSPW